MKDPKWKTVLPGILIGFGTISLSVLFFFILYKISEIRIALDKLLQILAPGSVLPRPLSVAVAVHK